MTRLIDADALEKAINEWMPKDQETWMESDIPPIENLVVSIMMTIEEQPTVDAVPVIRCKDCIHYERGKDYFPYCVLLSAQWDKFEVKDDSYCNRAERRDEQ